MAKAGPQAQAPASEFAPIDRSSIQIRIYERLRFALMSGAFSPGQVLIVRALAEEFGVSQMPVRDALAKLAGEQALEVQPSRSLAVPVLSLRQWTEIQDIRRLLEIQAAEHAAGRITPAMLDELAAINSAMHDSISRRDANAYLQGNIRFHFAIYQAAERPFLLRIIQSLWLRVGPAIRQSIDFYFTNPRNDIGSLLRNHDAILDSFRRHDTAAACRHLEVDITGARELFTGEPARD